MMKKRIVTGILSAVMTIIMCIGAVMTAFAVEGDETDSTAAITKNLEIRWCDDYLEVYEMAQQIRSCYYTDKMENNNDRKVVDEHVL